MIQTIHIENLWCEAIIGIYPHEREQAQPLCLTLQLDIDAALAIRDDSIARTLDYEMLARTLKQHTESHPYQLLETLLAKLLEEIASFDAVLRCDLRISKPKALEQMGATVAISGVFER